MLPATIQPWIYAPGTHYCWVAWGNVDSKLAQGFCKWPALRESNPRPLDLRSNALTARPPAPHMLWHLPWPRTSRPRTSSHHLYQKHHHLLSNTLIALAWPWTAQKYKWALFLNDGQLYTHRTKLPASSIEELRACCSQKLRLELFIIHWPTEMKFNYSIIYDGWLSKAIIKLFIGRNFIHCIRNLVCPSSSS